MRRAFVFVLLLMSVVSQCLAIAGRADTLGHVKDEGSHAVLHWKGEAHHHLEDGSLQLDDSDESMRHFMADCLLTEPSVQPSVLAALPPAAAVRPPSVNEPPRPEPNLPGLKRPPRSAA
ncbi:MAG: hypothetical protein HOQ10_09755 [Frateuria sp.]|nr:hypothetical protein [Frateuria sp.]